MLQVVVADLRTGNYAKDGGAGETVAHSALRNHRTSDAGVCVPDAYGRKWPETVLLLGASRFPATDWNRLLRLAAMGVTSH